MAKEITSLKETQQYEDIKSSLIAQLESMIGEGEVPSFYLDMVDNYMGLWLTAKALQLDIEKRGVVVSWSNGEKQKGKKKNDSVTELYKTIQQMTKVLESLEIKPSEVGIDPDGYKL